MQKSKRSQKQKTPSPEKRRRSPRKSASPQKVSPKKQKEILKNREEGFSVSGNEHIDIPEYNSLFDKNLSIYYSSPKIRKILQNSCLVGNLHLIWNHFMKTSMVEF